MLKQKLIDNKWKWSTKALKRMGITEEVIKKQLQWRIREVPTFHSGHKKSNY
ncbi:hypothetical protein HYD78_02975 [Mycoplasmopsis bovis]|nr:hypothetical protein [Mycoplasmopsis bovis]QQH43375.1 hypothetical protein HYD78_02975 [Mycoplasmopsis bovis]